MPNKKTKILCTLGPSSSSVSTIKLMLESGMDAIRLNFSHGTYDDFNKLIKNAKLAASSLKKELVIMQDLQGPKIRIGKMPEKGFSFKSNEQFILSTAIETFENKKIARIPVQYKSLHKDLKENDTVLIEDGLIELKVLSINKTEITCKAINGGTIFSHKGLNSPTASLSAFPLTEKDLKDLEFGLKNKLDIIAISFVRNHKDIEFVRKLLKKHKSTALICAKIERHEALLDLENIIKATDIVMVARGDLGVEIPMEEVPFYQDKIIKIAEKLHKPVIVATQMLQSMVESPRPTRAEISDAATAINQHADFVMLSNETASGKYPVEAVKTLSKVEQAFQKHFKILNKKNAQLSREKILENITKNALELSVELNAKIVVITSSGLTAKLISKQKPEQEIITITENKKNINELKTFWGLNKIYLKKFSTNNLLNETKEFLLKQKICSKNQNIILIYNSNKLDKLIATSTL